MMEEMIARWVRETKTELEKAKENQNLFRINEMRRLQKALIKMRDELFKQNFRN